MIVWAFLFVELLDSVLSAGHLMIFICHLIEIINS